MNLALFSLFANLPLFDLFLGFLLLCCCGFLNCCEMDFASRLNKLLKQSTEFKSWVLVFGCFPRVLIILGLFLLFWISLKVVQFSFHFGDLIRPANVRAGFWLKASVVEVCDSKTVQNCRRRRLGWLKKKKKNGFWFSKFNLVSNYFKWEENVAVIEDDVQNEEKEIDSEDGEFDVVKLRRLVKVERKLKKEALEELEKERMAAASAAEEAMAMIFRLQHEKSTIEIRANQFQRMMEQKEQYDQEVIDCLQGIIMEYEFEGSLSERSCKSTGIGDSTSLFDSDMEFILEDSQMNEQH